MATTGYHGIGGGANGGNTAATLATRTAAGKIGRNAATTALSMIARET